MVALIYHEYVLLTDDKQDRHFGDKIKKLWWTHKLVFTLLFQCSGKSASIQFTKPDYVVPYRTNKWFLNFVWLIYLHLCILVYRVLFVLFKPFFSAQMQRYGPVNCVWFVQGYPVLAGALIHFCLCLVW